MSKYQPITRNGFTATPDDEGYIWEVKDSDGYCIAVLHANEEDGGYAVPAHVKVDGGRPISSFSAYSANLENAITRVLSGLHDDGWIYAEQCTHNLPTIEAWLVRLHKTITEAESWFAYTNLAKEIHRLNRLKELVQDTEQSETFYEKAQKLRVIYDGMVDNRPIEQIQTEYDNTIAMGDNSE